MFQRQSYIYSSACPFRCGLCSSPREPVNTLNLAASMTAGAAIPAKLDEETTPIVVENTNAHVDVVEVAHATAAAATATCVALKCAPGVTFNPVTCLCPCPTGFTDDVCSVYDCNFGVKDSVECYGIDCSAAGSSIICPQTCFNCPNPLADESARR